MMPQCDPLSPGFFSIVHTLLHLWAANISLNGCLERTDTMLRNGLYGSSFLSSVHLLLFISRKYPFICVQICFTMVNICKISLFKRITLMSACFLLTLGENTVMFVSPN